jgi:hypothetical protein
MKVRGRARLRRFDKKIYRKNRVEILRTKVRGRERSGLRDRSDRRPGATPHRRISADLSKTNQAKRATP